MALLFITCVSLSCDNKESTERNLKHAMQSYLYKDIDNDSSKVKYKVQNVAYVYDDNKYLCEFTVHMQELTINMKTRFDTTGIMKATVTKDFKTVTRLN